jgi:undecaprenyl-diphosphatase
MAIPNDFDSTTVLFLNKFVGKSRFLDGLVELISDTALLNGCILFVAFLWLIWFRDKREESRIRLLMGGVAAALTGGLSRMLQFILPSHVRPLYSPDLRLTWPIGVKWGSLSHWNSFPSDHASFCFALATVIWIRDRRLGTFAFFWAAIANFARIYLGYHYPTDILGGAVLGIFTVILFQRLPSPPIVYRLLVWERYDPPTFYAVAFIASYLVGTLYSDFQTIAYFIVHLLGLPH